MKLNKFMAACLAALLCTSLMADYTYPLTLGAAGDYVFSSATDGQLVSTWNPAGDVAVKTGWSFLAAGASEAVEYPLAAAGDEESKVLAPEGGNSSKFKLDTAGGQLRLATVAGGSAVVIPVQTPDVLGDAVEFSTMVKFTFSDEDISFADIANSGAKTAVFAKTVEGNPDEARIAIAHGGYFVDTISTAYGFAYLQDQDGNFITVAKGSSAKVRIQLKSLAGGEYADAISDSFVVFQAFVGDSAVPCKVVNAGGSEIGFQATGNEEELFLSAGTATGPWLLAAFYAKAGQQWSDFHNEYLLLNSVAFQGTSDEISGLRLVTISGETPAIDPDVPADTSVANIATLAAAQPATYGALESAVVVATTAVGSSAIDGWTSAKNLTINQLNAYVDDGGDLLNAYLCNMGLNDDDELVEPTLASAEVTAQALADALDGTGLTADQVVAFGISSNFALTGLNGEFIVEAFDGSTDVSGFVVVVPAVKVMYVDLTAVDAPANIIMEPKVVPAD